MPPPRPAVAVPADPPHLLTARRRWVLVWCAIAYAALYCTYLALHVGENTRAFQDAWFLPLWLIAGAGSLAGAALPGTPARERRAWQLIGWGWLLSLAGDVLDTSYRDATWLGPISDLLYTAFYPLVLAGFLLLAAAPRDRNARIALALEVTILATAAVSLAWYYVWSASGAPTILGRHYGTGIWPIAEIAILATAGAALRREREAPDRQARDLLGLGALLVVVADFALVVLAGEPPLAPSRQLAAMVMAGGTVAYAAAGLCARETRPRAFWNVSATLPYIAITLVTALLLFELLQGGRDDAAILGLAIGSVILTILVITRLLVAESRAIDEAAVRVAQERRFRALVQGANDATIVVDAEGVVRYASESCTRVFGVRPAALRDQPLGVVAPDAASELRRAVAAPTDGAVIRWTRTGEAGRTHLETVVSDLRPVPEVGGLVLTTRDVTERVALEQQLGLSQRLDALGLLAGGVAHDINNLLMTVQANVDLLRDDDASRTAPELQEIAQATERGGALCRQLLVFGRPSAGERRRLSLAVVVRDLLPMLRRALPSQLALDLEVGPGPDVVHIDRAQVESALINVVMNARDAIRAEGSIRISVGRIPDVGRAAGAGHPPASGGFVRLTVRDDGIGMDADTVARALEPFFTTKAAAGTGLGLAAVYGTMKALGGGIRIDTAPGRGSSVHLDFPLSPGSAEEVRPPAVAAPLRAGRGRLLLVEDELAVRTALERSLARSGFDVVSAADGVEALGTLDRLAWEVDAVVSDLSMPRMNGATLCTRVRSRSPAMPFVLMSGYASPALGADSTLPADIARISKPFKLADLVHLLSRRDEGPAS